MRTQTRWTTRRVSLYFAVTGEQMAAIVLDVQVWSSICGKVHYPHGPGYHGEELPGQRGVCRYFWHSSGVNERVTCDWAMAINSSMLRE